MNQIARVALGGLALASTAATVASAQPVVSKLTVARSGEPAGDMGGDFEYSSLCTSCAIGHGGEVAFVGTVSGTGVTNSNNAVLFAGPVGASALVTREGVAAPGTPDPTFFQPSLNSTPFSSYIVTSSGEIAFVGQVNRAGAVLDAIFTGPIGSVSYVAGEGFQAPDEPTGTTLRFLNPPISANFQALTVFTADVFQQGVRLHTADEFSAIEWLNTQNGAPLVGGTWAFQGTPMINDQGNVAFVALLSGQPVNQRRAIYAGSPQAIGIAAREGAVAPDLGSTIYGRQSSTVFRSFDPARVRIANDQVIAFSTPVTGMTDGAIFLGLFTDVRLFVADGQQAPGLPAGVLLDGLGQARIELNGNAEVAFIARLTGPGVDSTNDSAIFEGPPNAIRMLVREGDAAPNGGTIGDLVFTTAYLGYNDRRQIAFFNTLSTGQGAYLGTTPAGRLAEFARQASTFRSDDGVVASLGAGVWTRAPNSTEGSTESGRAIAFNNDGWFVVPLCFAGSGGSGIFRFRADDPCVGDLTSTGATLDGQPGFGVPDGASDLDDLGYFLGFWIAGDAAIADVTSTGASLAGQPGFGVPDGAVDLDDLGLFLNVWSVGCP